MKKKVIRIILSILTIIFIWLIFIWGKYSFLYKNYSQKDIDKIFENENIDAPVYDSIYLRGYQVYYLTNKKNTYFTKEEDEKPYLVLMHETGHNSSYFLEYFKNKKLNNSFHIIAPDRIGFGKTHLVEKERRENRILSQAEEEFGSYYSYVNSIIPNEILDEEHHYLNELRMIYMGDSSPFAFKNYMNEYLSFNKMLLFYPNMNKRNKISQSFSNLITSSVIRFSLPKNYVNMHKEQVYLDSIKNEDLKSYINFAKNNENKENNKAYVEKPNPYIKKGVSKFIFFKASSEKSKADIQNIINSPDNFILDVVENKNIYKSPEFVTKEILKTNDYTEDYRRMNLTDSGNEN